MASSIFRSRFALLALMLAVALDLGCLQDDFDTACVIANNCDDSSVDSTAETSGADTAPDSRADTTALDASDARDTSPDAVADADAGDGCKPIACPATACGTIDDGCGGKIDCPGCASGKTCDTTSHTCVCKPITSCPTGLDCGSVSDGCGGTFTCPSCTGGKTCNTTTNKCETTCTPASTCPSGKCGTIDNGCGTGTLTCPGCTSPQSCGGGGTVGICGCTPSGSCGARVCGTVADGCGGSIACGSLGGACPSATPTCNASGACVCTPLTSCTAGKVCGTMPDGCGGSVTCGPSTTCSASTQQTCKSDGTGYVPSTCVLGCSTSSCIVPTRISVGWQNACVSLSDGTIRCWGANANGEVGDGTKSPRYRPVTIAGLSGALGVAQGDDHTCAWTSGGQVYCWGANANGQLGNSTFTASTSPVLVTGISAGSGVQDVVCGSRWTCARFAAGYVKCWGYNGFGAVGDGTAIDRSSPGIVAGVSAVTSIGGAAGTTHVCVVDGGTVKCWGDGSGDRLGAGGSTTVKAPQLTVPSIATATQVSVSGYTTCVRLSSGGLQCWGYNNLGEVGDGSRVQRNAPTSVFGIASGALAVRVAGFGCAFMTDGSTQCWGDNSPSLSPAPAAVAFLAGATDLSGYANYPHATCAIISGDVICFGGNDYGQLADGTTTTPAAPEHVHW